MVRTTISARDIDGLDQVRPNCHPITFAFVADRNPLIPTSTARSATTAKGRLRSSAGMRKLRVRTFLTVQNLVVGLKKELLADGVRPNRIAS